MMNKLLNHLPNELQILESRMLMAASPQALGVTLTKGALSITGTKFDDQIVVTYNGTSCVITNGSWTTTKTGTITKLTINGKAGNDTITVASSTNLPTTLLGDLGNDHLIAPDYSTSLNGGGGDDSLEGGDGNDTLLGGVGNDNLSGGDGTDDLDYTDHTKYAITLVLGQDGTVVSTGETDTITDDIENARGGAGADHITAAAAGSIIYGNAGNDTLIGLAGNDYLYGGAGNDSIDGGDGNDEIRADAGNDTLNGNDGDDKLYGDAGNDLINGGDDDDSLYGGAGNDSMNGGNGDDLILALGGGALDSSTGGMGTDTFWADTNGTELITDADNNETSNGFIHLVSAFANKVTKELGALAIADPTMKKNASVKYRNFKDNPIFSTSGPSIDDIRQGQLGDCYFLAQIGSFAELDENLIRQSIVNFGDGTYGVQFIKNGAKVFYRIDADLPSYSVSTLAYAAFGAEGSIWAPLMEKAWAYFRQGKNTYASIEAGFMTEVANAFGKSNSWGYTNSNPQTVLDMLKSNFDAGKSITIGTGTQPGNSLLVGGHAYTLTNIVSDGNGGYTITVRNPWATDGYTSGDGNQDGYITMTGTQFLAWTNAYAICNA